MPNLADNGRGFPAKDLSPYLRRFEFSFAPNAALAPDPTAFKGCIPLWSVTRVSTGLFRITLRDSFNDVEAVGGLVQLATVGARYLQVGAIDVANRTIDIRTIDGAGAVQDVAAAAGNRINLSLVLRCTGQRG